MFEKKIEELRADHPDLAAAYDTLAHLKASFDAKASDADKRMSETIGHATHLLKVGMGKIHDRVRTARGGDPVSEAKESPIG